MSIETPNRTIIGLVCLHLALLVLFVFVRFVDGDEGFYLSAAQQVAQGKLPYIDFFFPQMPFLPSVQSFVAGHGFATLYLTRLLGLVPAVLALLLFVRIVISLVGDRRGAVMAIGLYTLSGLILAWHSPAKTYAWTDLFLLIVFWSVVRLSDTKRQFWLVVSAVALALAINFRLVMAVVLIPYGYYLWRLRRTIRIAWLLLALGTVVVVTLPTLRLLSLSPDRLLFDNFGFHLMRDPTLLTLWSSVLQRIATLGKLAVNPQVLIVTLMFVMTLVGARRTKSNRSRMREYINSGSGVAAIFGLTIALVYLLPAPTHQQYFVQALPFVIIASLPLLDQLAGGTRLFTRWNNATVIRAAAWVYVLGLIPYFVIYLGAVRAGDTPYRIGNVGELCRFVRENPASGPILSEWAGVPVLSGRETIPGLEFVGFDYPLPIPDSLKRHYHLPVNDNLKQLLRERIPALYVVWNAPDTPLQQVADSNYVVIKRFDSFVVYARKGSELE